MKLFPKEKIRKQLHYTVTHSDFYKKKFSNFTRRKNDLLNVFLDLPFTCKNELLYDQETFPPFGSNLSVKTHLIRRIHKTSGTTNRPLIVALTDNDISNTINTGAKCFMLSGLTKEDIVIHCLNYNMWAGGYTDHQSLETTGACVIPFGVGKTKNLIETILMIRPTTIHCTPSYLSKIELILQQDFSLEPADLRLKLGLFGGEGGLQNIDFRKSIENKWGLKAMNANYGMSDVLSIFASECKYQKGLHFLGSELLYPEIIDIKTNESLPFETGVEGEQVLTNLEKEAQPLIRYRTGDIIRIKNIKKCKCGGNEYIFDIIGRIDDMIVIKGINVFINSIGNVINKNLEVLSGVYQVYVNKDEPIDTVRIVAEKKIKIDKNKYCLAKTLRDEFSNILNITPEVVLIEEGSIPRTEGKFKKLIKSL